MDALHDWVLAYPAPARMAWVLALVLATLLVWSLFFCCWENRSSVSPLERYLSAMKKNSKTKHQSQRKKKQKEKSATSALVNDGIVGMITLATPPTQEKQMVLKGDKKEKKQKDEKEEKLKEGKEEKQQAVKEQRQKVVKEEKQKAVKEEKQKVVKEEKQKAVKEEKQKVVNEEKQKAVKEEKQKAVKEEKQKAVKEEKQKVMKEEKLKAVKEEKQKAVKEEKLKVAKEEKLKVVKEEKLKMVKEEKLKVVKEEKQKAAKAEKQIVVKEEKQKVVKEEKQNVVKEEKQNAIIEEKAEKQDEHGNNPTVKKRNKRRLKVTIAPEAITFESSEKAMSESSRPRLRERSASEESRSELCSSTFPGDTLPWNLAKHQRVKRSKSASGDVLDPAERAVIRIADERDRVQKKTFTKWVNKHLMKHWKAEAQRHITDLYEDLRDGHSLISLLEVLSGETLPREKGRMRFHKLQNVQIALDFLKHRQVKLVNIRNDDIADGNPKLTLGLIWTIILHFQISDIQVNGQSDDMTAKEKLLLWSQRMVEGYQSLRCDNFTTSWRDGRLFNAIIHKHRPNLIDMSKVYRQTNLENLEQAFSTAERELGVTRLLDPEDVDVPHPDEKSIITYVSSLYDVMPRVPDVQDGVQANELELRWQEYYELVTMLLQWIRHHIVVFEESKFPNSYEEIEVLWRQFLKFKETELPAKEADKNRSKHIYKAFEGAVQSGQVKVPPGYHPIDVEKEWGRLHAAILERERLLRNEFERLERLQRVVSKVQMESGVCEEQLNQVETLLQRDVRLLGAGKPVQHAAEIDTDLDKAETMIRFLFNDVQLLKDGRHLQAEQMYRRVYRLHERLVNLRSEYNLRVKSGVTMSQVPLVQTSMSSSLHQSPQRARPELDEVTLRYIQDLLAWVEENQRRMDTSEWGADLPSVESHLGSHRGLHQSIEEFKSKIERARSDENQLTPASKQAYRDYLAKLDLQYNKLLNSSKARLRNLTGLHAFVVAATKELMWLNEKEEEEVNYDWSDRNTNMTTKKDNYSGLMRDLEQREKRVNTVQATGDKLLKEGHPARSTIEAFTAALQTQWSWLLQLCCCLETHLKENTAYFQFFADVKEAEEKMKKIQETMKKKYICDRSITVTRLEDLLQDAADEKEHLAEFKTHLEGLNRRAKNIIQLKPRNPATPVKGKLPIQAVCDFKQIEITVHRGDECVLLNNSQPFKWKVRSLNGNEATVPSICFIIPPTNKEAMESCSGLDASLQKLMILWQKLHVDMKSLLSWQYLMRDIHFINSWNFIMFKTLKVEEYRLTLKNLEQHYQIFMRDSQDSELFGADERMQAESAYNNASQHYDNLLRSVEQGEQDESVCKSYITQIKDLRLRLEGCESRMVSRLRQPVDKEPLKACAQRTTEHNKVQSELEDIKKDLDAVVKQSEAALASSQQATSAPVLRSELDITLKKMAHVYSLSSVYLDKLKTIDLVIRSTQGAEDVLRKYENQLRDVHKVPANEKELESNQTHLKKLCSEAESDKPVFDRLEAELQDAVVVNERMSHVHSERDAELDHYVQLVTSLKERWQAVFAQVKLRQRELDLLGRQMQNYRQSYDWLIQWITDAKQRQNNIQAMPISDSKALKEQLAQEKKLLEEIENNKEKVDECQKYAKAYIDTVKDHELQLVTYKALVEPFASPLKKIKVESVSDNIIQEYVTLRTRYSELLTLASQYIKFIIDTQRRLENEEKATEKLKEEERKKLAEMQAELEKQRQLAESHAKAIAKAEQEAEDLKLKMKEEVSKRQVFAVDAEKQKQNIQQELQELRNLSDQEIKVKSQQVEEVLQIRTKIEEEIRIIRLQLETTTKQKSTAEAELQQLREKAAEADRLRKAAQEEAEKLRKQVNEETQKKREAEEELKRRSEAEKEAAKQKQKAMEELEKLKQKAEEAERRMKQAELEKERQIKVVEEVAQKSAATELQSKRLSFAEKTTKLEESLKQEQGTVIQLQEEAERLKRQQAEADKAREEAEKELDIWRQKANEALRLRLQAEEEAHKKSVAQEEAEKQKEEAKQEAKRRAKAEEVALKQKEVAEEALEKQRKEAEETAQQKLTAEQELIRLKLDFDHAEQQRTLLDDELQRLKNEVNTAVKQRQVLEDELSKVRKEMEILIELKVKAEKESMSNTEKSKQLLESEASKMRELAEEATKLRLVAEEAKKQRQLAEDEAAQQRAEAAKILKEKLAAIDEATRVKTEAEIALKEKEAENERLKRKAEDEAYQRKALEDKAAQHKQDIEEKIKELKTTSDAELGRQKEIVEEILKQKKVVEEEIHILKLNFKKASTGKQDLELELKKLKSIADETQESKIKAEEEAEKFRNLALEEEKKRKEAEEKVKKISAAEKEAAKQCLAAQQEAERLKNKAKEVKQQKDDADREAEKQIILAKEAAQRCTAAEQKAQNVLVQQKEDSLAQTKLKDEYEKAKKLAEDAAKAKESAEKEAALFRQKADEADCQKQAAEAEAAKLAKAQEDAEKLRKEAEAEASKRAKAEKAALKQKKQAEAEMAKHKEIAETTLKQKSLVEQELETVKLQLDETDKQKSLLDDELKRLKDEVSDAVKQKAQVEDELTKIKLQMEELIKLKVKIEAENQRLMKKDKENTKKLLEEEAENMKKLAEEAERLSVEAQEASRLRQVAETELTEQRELADKMLKEKMLAIQEASKLKAEAENLQKQKDKAQEEAQKLLEAKKEMQQRLEQDTVDFQKSLEAERKKQKEVTAEAEKLKLRVTELSNAQLKAEEEANKFKKQAEEIRARLIETEKQTSEKFIAVEKLEVERLASTKDADDLRKAIADLEREKEKLKKDAADLQNKAKEMANAQQEQMQQEKTALQQTFLTEKEILLKKEKTIEAEKMKLGKQLEDEVKKAQTLKDEQENKRKQMEEEKMKLQAILETAVKKQKDAEDEMLNKQKELDQLEKVKQQQEKLMVEENKKLREKLQQLQEAQKPTSQTKEIEIQTDSMPENELITATVQEATKKVFNGSTEVDGEKANEQSPLAFDGIQEKVPASRLNEIGVLNKKEFDKLKKGKTTVQDLAKLDKVKMCLKGKDCIGGVIVDPKQKMGIYQALKEKKISPNTALILLEAQAASGYIIDPIKNRRLSVNDAVKESVVGPELHTALLSAERAATGFKDPFTGHKISLFEAMKKGLVSEEQATKLLDVQIATGGIIDPVNSHRVSVQTACKQGQMDEELNKLLSNPPDDRKGFTDPNTQESLSYHQLLERCKTDPETGLLFLAISQTALPTERTYTDEEAKDAFSKTNISVPFGRFQGKIVTIWEVINSEYFSEDQRKDLIRQYKSGKITVEKIIRIVITVVEDKDKKKELAFDGIRSTVPASELLDSKIINKDLYNELHNGKTTIEEVSQKDSVKKALKGTSSIAGVFIESTKEKVPIYEAMKKNILEVEPAIYLLEAQAGTGFIIDPVKKLKLTVDEAVKSGIVGPELHEKLRSAERAVSGYKDPYTGKTASLFEAMQKDLINKDQGTRLLEAQIGTGGIIDPVKSYRIPQDIAYKRGYFSEEMNKCLNSLSDDSKVFIDPNTKENVSYAQLQKSCITDKETGFPLFPLSEKAVKATELEQPKEALNKATLELQSGPFKGRKVTIWEIITSEYLTEEQRIEVIRQYKSGTVTIEKIISIVITLVEENEIKKQQDTFTGLREPVSAMSLFESKIIDKTTYDLLQKGQKKPKEISENESVKRYLQGSECIAGVLNENSKEKLSIYQAMKEKLLTPNTGLSLLEAQAASGFIVDPIRNLRFTVDDAVKAGLVGPELHEKLLSAEKAVTGYKDPYTGDKISLFQAMQKELLPREHAIPLLEVQEATGGIIDPVNSHHIPTDIAIQRGYLSKQMAKSFKDPSDDIKGFTDPNKNESVTYKQLIKRCTKDSDFGFFLLPLSKAEVPKEVEKSYIYTEKQAQTDLASTQIAIPLKSFAGKQTSLWDVMASDMLPEEDKQRLIEQYRSGKITKERMIIIIIEIIEQREVIKTEQTMLCDIIRRRVTIEELYSCRIIDLETYNLLKQGKKTIREVMEMATVKKYLFGTGSIAGVLSNNSTKISIHQAMKRGIIKPDMAIDLLEAQAATGFITDPVKCELLTVDEAVRKGLVGPELHDKLLSAERAVMGYKDPYSGKTISLYQAMKKGLVPEEYALKILEAQIATGGIIDHEYNFHLPDDVAMQRGYINKETIERLSSGDVKGFTDPTTDEKSSYANLLKRCKVDKESGMHLLSLADKKLLVRGLRKQITLDELLSSEIIDQKTYTELIEGLISVDDISKDLKKYLEGTSCIAGVYVEASKERLSIYQAMKKNMIRPGTAFELLEAQAATGYVIDPIKNLKLTVNEAVKLGVVGPEFKDKLLSAERAVTGYNDPYSGKVISLFQAMKKGLILKDHGIRLLESQIATGGIIDPEESHRLPVEMAYKRGLFDEEMNSILTDPSDDTKGFFDPNTEENLTYLQLMERCMTDPETGLALLMLKEKKRERKTSSKSSVRKRRVVIVDPETGKEMSVYEAYRKGLIDHQTYMELAEQECEWEEITTSSADGVKSMIIDRRSGRQYDIDDAITRGLIDQSALDQYRAGTLSITEFADMLSGNMSGSRSRSSSFGSTSSYPMSPVPSIKTPATTWTDPTEETGPVAGILDTDTLEKVSVTEAMHRNLVDNITGQRLLEAQACTGGIIDPNTGEKFTVADAMNKGLVDKIMVDRINLAQKAFQGFEDPRTKTKMSAAQALKKGWLYYEAGQRFLEVQYLTGGLIEPDVAGRVSLDEAVKKGTLDARTAQKLRDVSGYSKYLTCPKTKLKISYKDAMERSMIEEGSGLRLLEASSQSTKGLYSPYNVSGSGSASGSRSGSRTGSRSGSRRGSFDATGSGFTMSFSSTSYGSPSYGRRYSSGVHSELNMDKLKQALTTVILSRHCCSEDKRMLPLSQTQCSLIA
ncbi:plectin a isoform X3 [Tachysurus vachellii]|uniref:plectin a isoform X3 n=1 Tax=Tachysurus vachellii TaxID=175792 RepID=UPI00296AE7A5|nr:plectin a isoform X3 [Tachysurus vachellii]